jgi:hypothetical protein
VRLVINGDFATDLNGWGISGNSDADHTVTWTSQGARYQSTTTSPTLLFFQNSLTSGKTYKFTVDIAYTSGTIKLQTGSGASLFNPTLVEGTNTFYFTASSVQFLFIRSTTNVDVLIDNVSVKQVNGNPAIMTNQTSSDIENGSPYANIVVNGNFATNSDWNLGSGQWVISNGFAVGTNASNNLHTNQPVAPSNGIEYTVTFTLKDVTSGYIRVGINIADSTQFNSDGTYSLNVTSSGNNYLYITPSNFNGKITNITATEVNTGLQGYWKMGDGTNDEYPVIYDQTNPTIGSNLVVNGDF